MHNPIDSPDLLQATAVPGKIWLWVIFTVTATAIAGLFWWREKRLRRNMQERLAAQKSRASLELHTFQTQMDPHFIFNSLNAIHHYMLSSSTELAAGYLTRFSRLMRMVLENSGKEWISLEEELEGLELYIQLEQLRFDGRFAYTVNGLGHAEDGHLMVPPFIIQPFVQNAIWYRLLQRQPDGNGRLLITVERRDGDLVIRVEDNGTARHTAFQRIQQHTDGLKVAAERLHWLNDRYQTHAGVSSGHLYDAHHEKTGSYTVIRLPDVNAASSTQEAALM
ncbi:sensor histidine kinase [Chitinophaga lutea]